MNLGLIDFETDPAAGGDGGAPAAAAPPDPTPDFTPQAPETWSADELDQMIGRGVERALTGMFPAQPQAAPALPTFDPFQPESFDARASALFETVLDKKLAELGLDEIKHFAGIAAQDHAERVANQFLDGLKEEVGDFDRDRARLMGLALQNAGYQPADALRRAATLDKEYRASTLAEGKRLGVEEYKAELERLKGGGGPTQPPSGGAAGEPAPSVPTGQNRYVDTIKSSLERLRAQREGVAG